MDTRKELQNPSTTKTYPVGFDHDAELSSKKWSKKIKQLWRYFME